MKNLRLLTLAFMLGTLLLSSSLLAQTKPTEPGVYIQSGDHWEKLYLANSSGIRMSSPAGTAFSYGIASMKTIMTFRDPTAPVKTLGARPVFYVVGPTQTAPRDMLIVRLKEKKDHRELVIGKANAYTGAKVEYPASDVTEVTVTDSDAGRLLTPKADLKPGEYLLFVGTPTQMPAGYGGYDFSDVAAK
jgi:hypothetical protein